MMVMVMMKITAVALCVVRDAQLFLTGSLHVAASRLSYRKGRGKVTTSPRTALELCQCRFKPQVRNSF